MTQAIVKYIPNQAKFERCLKPSDAICNPVLIIFCDASEDAYGSCAYVRWQRQGGGFACNLIVSKNRLAPIKKMSIDKIELCGAVLSKRLKSFSDKECRYTFEKCYYIVDSQIVHAMIQKSSTQECRPKHYTTTFVPAPPGTIRATAEAHRSCPSERFSGLHIDTYRPSDHAGSAVGLHDCLYRGAKTGNLQLRSFQPLSNICQALLATHHIPLSHRYAMADNNRFRPLWISRCHPLSKT